MIRADDRWFEGFVEMLHVIRPGQERALVALVLMGARDGLVELVPEEDLNVTEQV